MYNYCTLFDSNFLTRGLAMYESLKMYSKPFHLYIFAFDDRAYELLYRLDLESASIISLKEFEDEKLLEVKKDRTPREYCWTSTPSVILYAIEHFGLGNCTYLDADLYFFSDPSVLIDEMGDASVLLTEHRYSPQYEKFRHTSGIYCVQFMTFKSDERGIGVLRWWREACLDWCYDRIEDGKFGDQKYLDDWTTRFDGIHVLKHLGGGLAPWNVSQYDLEDGSIEPIFYHFHNFKFIDDRAVYSGYYKFRDIEKKLFYEPYEKHLANIKTYLEGMGESYDYHGGSSSK
ncbi:MAG: hypothetical protein WCR69_08270 [Sulfuricurvum sp.]